MPRGPSYHEELVRVVDYYARTEIAALTIRDARTTADLEEAIRRASASTWSGKTGEELIALARRRAVLRKRSWHERLRTGHGAKA
jgi:hypothetical protein